MRPITILAVVLTMVACGSSDRAGEDEGTAAGWPLEIESVTVGKKFIDDRHAQTCDANAFKGHHDNTVVQFSARARTLRDNDNEESRCHALYPVTAVLRVEARWRVRLWCGIRGAVRVEDTDKKQSSADALIIVESYVGGGQDSALYVRCRIRQGPESGEFEVGGRAPAGTSRHEQRPFWFDVRCLDAGRYNVTAKLAAYAGTHDDLADAESFEYSAVEIDPDGRCDDASSANSRGSGP